MGLKSQIRTPILTSKVVKRFNNLYLFTISIGLRWDPGLLCRSLVLSVWENSISKVRSPFCPLVNESSLLSKLLFYFTPVPYPSWSNPTLRRQNLSLPRCLFHSKLVLEFLRSLRTSVGRIAQFPPHRNFFFFFSFLPSQGPCHLLLVSQLHRPPLVESLSTRSVCPVLPGSRRKWSVHDISTNDFVLNISHLMHMCQSFSLFV